MYISGSFAQHVLLLYMRPMPYNHQENYNEM